MQDGVGEDLFNEAEQTLAGMGRLEMLVLGINSSVSLGWHYIVVMNCQCLSTRHLIVTCRSKCLCVCM